MGWRHIPVSISILLNGRTSGFTLVQTKIHEPIILSLQDIISPSETKDMLHNIESLIRNGDCIPTTSYQEDVFSKDKWEEEDTLLRSIIQPLVDDDLIPSEYAIHLQDDGDAALKAFVYAVTRYQDRLSEENIILGANIIQRREAIERWKGDDGLAIMKLSSDDVVGENDVVDWGAISLGKRYELPLVILNKLEQLIPQLLHGSWITRDATLVQYSEGDLQVPHIDPCDATLLICLKSCDEGGDTCFPLLEQPLRLENKAGSGILFFSSNKVTGDDIRDTSSLHHGGKVIKGEKIVVQLMLDLSDDNTTGCPGKPNSWLDFVIHYKE